MQNVKKHSIALFLKFKRKHFWRYPELENQQIWMQSFETFTFMTFHLL